MQGDFSKIKESPDGLSIDCTAFRAIRLPVCSVDDYFFLHGFFALPEPMAYLHGTYRQGL
jgi:hypothetical protein